MGKRRSFSWTLLVGLLLALHLCVVLAQGAGRAVIKRGVIADDLYVAGGKVDILAEVKGDVIAAGGRVSVGQLVEGDVMVAGGSVTVTGQVLDDVRATGGAVTIDGDIGGDVVVSGGSVSLTPETHVSGRTWLAGGEVVIQGTLDQDHVPKANFQIAS